MSAGDGADQRLPVPTLTGEWLNFSGSSRAASARCGWCGSISRQGNLDAFEHAIYLDRLAVVDAFGKATTLSD